MSSSSSAALPAFVVRHLATIARNEQLTDYTVECGAGAKHGDGFMSNMLGITLVTAERRLPLICKLQLAEQPKPSDGKIAMDASLYFKREVLMYSKILPQLAQLQRAHGLTPESGFFSYPHCYVAEMAEPASESIIVLEDLRERQFELWNKLETMPFEAVAHLLQQLGRLTGLSFVLRDQQPALFAELEQLDDFLAGVLVNVESMAAIFDSATQQAIELVDADKDKTLLRAFIGGWRELTLSRRAPERLGRFGVLVHGDCHINNMMFRLSTGERRVPEEIVLIDWQAALIASPVNDLATFVWWCTEKQLRDEHFDELLHIYHDEVQRVIRVCGSDAEKLFSFDDLEAQMREYSINAVSMAACAVSYMITDPKDMQNLATLTKAGDEDDVNAKMLAPLTKSTEQRFKERLLDIVNDARRLGYLEKFEKSE